MIRFVQKAATSTRIKQNKTKHLPMELPLDRRILDHLLRRHNNCRNSRHFLSVLLEEDSKQTWQSTLVR
jgi:hypothetical protein